MITKIENLGECTHRSPLLDKYPSKESVFVSDEIKVRYDCLVGPGHNCEREMLFELAGPREKLYFKPDEARSAVVTCGGLSPGLNDVIRSIVMDSFYSYGNKSVLGIRYGYSGLNPKMGYEPVELTPQSVRDIHLEGGTILGSSRGGTDDMDILVDRLVELKIDILYTIGGDGTLKGAHKMAEIITKRGLKISIVGVPKTIDNDVNYVQRTFGFETAVSEAVKAIYSAHVEAEGAPNGIGLVKLMGRDSGFIAANATLAMNEVNFLLVPEVPFDLEGDNGFLSHLEKRLLRRGHAVICAAEGAGQDILTDGMDKRQRDASGNVVLDDIGIFLRDRIKEYFKKRGIPVNLKYIDPSYMIRSVTAYADDSIFCTMLGQCAVQAGMAGKTDMIVGQWNNVYTHMPIELVISERKKIDPKSRFWYSVLDATGQPANMKN
ncbi:MAG: ATP-dependent 6-phosphofructokinase [Spirochaetes bacterium]|jgi:6-phosphofructokinase 1|nr:ATP-dependent 6-phosphofructokinase [Spirochaetota bacterium]